MSSYADIVRQLLLDLALVEDGTTGDWPCFVGYLPDLPEKAVVCYDTAGTFDGRIMSSGEKVEHPGIQILVRTQTYVDAFNKVKEIAEALDGQRLTEVVFETTTYVIQNISRTGAVLPLGQMEDDRRRFHFSINAVMTIKAKP